MKRTAVLTSFWGGEGCDLPSVDNHDRVKRINENDMYLCCGYCATSQGSLNLFEMCPPSLLIQIDFCIVFVLFLLFMLCSCFPPVLVQGLAMPLPRGWSVY